MAIKKREYLDPHWQDDRKETIVCTIRVTFENDEFQDNRAWISNPEGDNTDWDAVMETYGVEKLDKDLEEREKKRAEQEKKRETERKRHEEKLKQEALFNRKLEVFKIKEVNAAKDRTLKQRIRRATNETEVIVLAAAIVQQQMQKEVEDGEK